MRACSLCSTSRIVVEPHLPTWMKTVTGVPLLLLLLLLMLALRRLSGGGFRGSDKAALHS